MSVLPDAQLEAYEASLDREAAWVPLADWVHEQRSELLGLRPPRSEHAIIELEFVSQLARRAFIGWASSRAAKQFELEEFIRHDACALLDELRINSVWPGSPVMLFGSTASTEAMRAPAALLPAVINAAIASAPRLLRRFEVWIPKNPPWGQRDDCCSQLEPLMRQRPRLAQHLVVRAPRKGLVEFVRRAADNRWNTITLAAPLNAADHAHLQVTAAQFPNVAIQLVDDTRRDALGANLRFVSDPDACLLEVTVNGVTTRGRTAPGRMLETQLGLALRELGVDFVTDLGMNSLTPRAVVRRGQLKLDSRVLVEPYFLRDGVVELAWIPADGTPPTTGHVRRIVE